MKRLRVRLSAAVVIGFCLWHMAAVALYLLPKAGFLDAPKHITKPYVLLFSQWQKWDIFSPDPLRRVSTYVVETLVDDEEVSTVEMNAHSLPWWRRAKELKVLGRIEGQWSVLGNAYALSLCDNAAFVPGSSLRLMARSTVLPARSDELASLAGKHLPVTQRTLGTAVCPLLP